MPDYFVCKPWLTAPGHHAQLTQTGPQFAMMSTVSPEALKTLRLIHSDSYRSAKKKWFGNKFAIGDAF